MARDLQPIQITTMVARYVAVAAALPILALGARAPGETRGPEPLRLGAAGGIELVLDGSGADILLPRAERGADRVTIRMALAGARPVTPRLEEPKGSIPAAQRASGRQRVTFGDAYPGIDAVFRSDGGLLAYDFVVAPGADPASIGLTFSGAHGVRIDAAGDLVLETAAGPLRHRRPRLFQEIGGVACEIDGAFELRSTGVVGFGVGPYDRSRTLLIDPALLYSDVRGRGRGYNGHQDVAVDAQGNATVVGYYPWDLDRGPADVSVTRVGPQGTTVFDTSFGGTYTDEPRAIALDGAGNIYVTGVTTSTAGQRPFPTTANAFQGDNAGGEDAFVVKLDATGTTVLYGSFLGGSGQDRGADVQVDPDGRILVVGRTGSTDFPTLSPFQAASGGGTDAFVTAIAPSGALAFSSYLGGTGEDAAVRTELLGRRLFLCGTTTSTDLPVRSALQPAFGGGASDAFLAIVGSDATLPVASYLGGGGADVAWGVGKAFGGYLYVAGSTSSTDFPTVNALQAGLAFPPQSDAFVAKLPGTLASFVYSTYLSVDVDADCAWSDERAPCGGIAVDVDGAAFVTARAPDDAGAGVLLAKLSADGQSRLSTVHGFGGRGIALRRTQLGLDLFVAGTTDDFLFPSWKTPGPRTWYQYTAGWVTKLHDGPNPGAQYEETDPRIAYSGSWGAVFAADLSGGRAMRSRTAGATAVISFAGTGIQVLGRRGPATGTAIVRQDWDVNFPASALDTYADLSEPRSVILSFSGLSQGTHTLTIEVGGAHNPKAWDSWIWVDGIRVIP